MPSLTAMNTPPPPLVLLYRIAGVARYDGGGDSVSAMFESNFDSTTRKTSGWNEVSIFSIMAFLPVTPSQFAITRVNSSGLLTGLGKELQLEVSLIDEVSVSSVCAGDSASPSTIG